MAEERVHFSGERERERDPKKDSREVKNSRARGEVCPGYLNSAPRGTSQWLS